MWVYLGTIKISLEFFLKGEIKRFSKKKKKPENLFYTCPKRNGNEESLELK
jgi:hypothetical protein